MTYWLNIHDPPKLGTSRSHHIYIQDKYSFKKREIKIGDMVYIYETKKSKLSDGKNGHIQLEHRLGGIIFLAEVISGPHENRTSWDKRDFSDRFDTKSLKENYIPLRTLKNIWLEHGLPEFNPRVNGGLRKLKGLEIYILKGM